MFSIDPLLVSIMLVVNYRKPTNLYWTRKNGEIISSLNWKAQRVEIHISGLTPQGLQICHQYLVSPSLFLRSSALFPSVLIGLIVLWSSEASDSHPSSSAIPKRERIFPNGSQESRRFWASLDQLRSHACPQTSDCNQKDDIPCHLVTLPKPHGSWVVEGWFPKGQLRR